MSPERICFQNLAPCMPLEPSVSDNATAPEPWEKLLFGEGDWPVYAVLDGAILTGLAEALAPYEARARCLFKNEAAVEFEDSAPWLFRLNKGCRFTRSLFVRDLETDIPWQRWGRNAYVLVQADMSFDALWHHLRRFTRIRATPRKWYLHRFWDPRSLSFVAADFEDTAWTPAVWKIPAGGQIHWFEADVLRTMNVPEGLTTSGADPELLGAMARYGFWLQAGIAWDAAATAPDDRRAFQHRMTRFCAAHGFHGTQSVEHVAQALMRCSNQALVEKFAARLPAKDALRSQSIAMAMEKYARRRGAA